MVSWSTYIVTPPRTFTTCWKPWKSTMAAALKVIPQYWAMVLASSSTPPAKPPPFWLPKANAALIFSSCPPKWVLENAGMCTHRSRGMEMR